MRPAIRAVLALCAAALVLAVPAEVSADETDNFTCRARLSRDSLAVLDSWVNAQIRESLARVNRRGSGRADEAGLVRDLQKAVGGSVPDPLTLVPHARFEKWIDRQSQIDRCHLSFAETIYGARPYNQHLAFRETIYGARPYNQPWLYPFLGRTVLVADSILLSGHVVGVDKINHFLREGLANWRAVNRRREHIAEVLGRELDPASVGWNWTEYGLKGMSLTGVLSYADVAAGYSGFRFWEDLLQLGRERSLAAYDAALGRFVQVRDFTFAAYVKDAWDEGINYSTFHPTTGREVAAALRARGMTMPVRDCRPLADLPDARLYVNPACLSR
jgi:hypothetical protein